MIAYSRSGSLGGASDCGIGSPDREAQSALLRRGDANNFGQVLRGRRPLQRSAIMPDKDFVLAARLEAPLMLSGK